MWLNFDWRLIDYDFVCVLVHSNQCKFTPDQKIVVPLPGATMLRVLQISILSIRGADWSGLLKDKKWCKSARSGCLHTCHVKCLSASTNMPCKTLFSYFFVGSTKFNLMRYVMWDESVKPAPIWTQTSTGKFCIMAWMSTHKPGAWFNVTCRRNLLIYIGSQTMGVNRWWARWEGLQRDGHQFFFFRDLKVAFFPSCRKLIEIGQNQSKSNSGKTKSKQSDLRRNMFLVLWDPWISRKFLRSGPKSSDPRK